MAWPAAWLRSAKPETSHLVEDDMFWGGNATRVLEIKQGQKLDEFGQFLVDMGWMHHVMCAEKMMLHKKRVFGKKTLPRP